MLSTFYRCCIRVSDLLMTVDADLVVPYVSSYIIDQHLTKISISDDSKVAVIERLFSAYIVF